MTVPCLHVDRLAKRFGTTQAAQRISFVVRAGETHGLVGRNGSGKSTVVKILAGYHQSDRGRVWSTGPDGAEVQPRISFVHQEFGLVDEMTVAENFGLVNGFPVRGVRGIDWRGHQRQVHEVLRTLDIDVDPRAKIRDLRPIMRALVAISRSLAPLLADASTGYLVLDEATASLEKDGVQRLVAVLEGLRTAHGIGVLFVSHRLSEVLDICDRITVLDNGTSVGTFEADDLSAERLAGLILGIGCDGVPHEVVFSGGDDDERM